MGCAPKIVVSQMQVVDGKQTFNKDLISNSVRIFFFRISSFPTENVISKLFGYRHQTTYNSINLNLLSDTLSNVNYVIDLLKMASHSTSTAACMHHAQHVPRPTLEYKKSYYVLDSLRVLQVCFSSLSLSMLSMAFIHMPHLSQISLKSQVVTLLVLF